MALGARNKGDLDYETTDLMNRIRQAEQYYGGRGTSHAITSPLFAICLPFWAAIFQTGGICVV